MKVEKKAQRQPVVVGSARSQTKGDIIGSEKELVGGRFNP